MTVATDRLSITKKNPFTVQRGKFSVVELSLNDRDITDFIKSKEINVSLEMTPPYQKIVASTLLAGSQKNILFAANHCASSQTSGPW